jgi:signal transduction histidine kinase
MKTEFINVAAHELRTPIQPIIGLGEALRSKDKLKVEEYEEYLDVIIRNARRLQQLADDILDVTKIESKSLKLKKERFDLRELITVSVNEYSEIIKKSKRSVKLEYRPKQENNNPLFIHADGGRISQVVSNLLSKPLNLLKKETLSSLQKLMVKATTKML